MKQASAAPAMTGNHAMRPRFSVLVPTHDRAVVLERVLAAWQRQVPGDLAFELIVVDDGSTDGTAALLAATRPARCGFTWFNQAAGGPARARNRALERARGELVLFSGDDIEPSPTLLAEHDRAHRELGDSRVAVLGLTRWHPEARLTATMRHVDGPGAQQFSYHYLEDGREYDFRHFYTSNLSVRRELLAREPNGFSSRFPHAAFEDAEYSYRLARHGMRIVYRAAPVAFHHHHYDVRSFLARQERCGAMAQVLVGLHPELAGLLTADEVRRRVWRERFALPARRRARGAIARDLEACEERLLAFCWEHDRADSAQLPTILLPLFRYGFLKGLAQAALPARSATAVRAGLVLDLLEPALVRFLAELEVGGQGAPPAAVRSLAPLLGRPAVPG